MKAAHPRRSSFLSLIAVLLIAACATQEPSPAATPAPATMPAAASSPTPAPATQAASPYPAAAAPTPVESRQAGTVRYQIIPEQSEARYRVREQLANLSLPNDAIGSTNQLNGTITILDDGSVDPAGSTIVVDLSTLESDRSQRDNFLRRNVLQTDQYPHATFVARAISGLPNPPPESGEVVFQLTGDLTIRDVTREVTWDVTGTINGDQAAGLAVTSFPIAGVRVAGLVHWRAAVPSPAAAGRVASGASAAGAVAAGEVTAGGEVDSPD